MQDSNRMLQDLPQTVANIVLYYIKKHYHKYLETHGLKIIPDPEIKQVVFNLYEEKAPELKKFIRNTMRKNYPNYDQNLAMKTGIEEIILEIFDDRDFSVSKVTLEISNYQKGLKN